MIELKTIPDNAKTINLTPVKNTNLYNVNYSTDLKNRYLLHRNLEHNQAIEISLKYFTILQKRAKNESKN